MANKHSVVDSGDLRKYFAAIPNVVFKLGLNPYELALYSHFKQAAGDGGGVCWKSRATIAKEAGMSSGMVTKARQALELKRPELGGRALITVKEEPSKSGGKGTCLVSITDIWAINMAKFSTSPTDIATSPHDVESKAPSPHDGQRHTATLSTSPHDHKEKPIKKNPEERKEYQQHALRADTRGTRLPDDFCLNSEMREWAASNTPLVDLDIALAEFCDYWRAVPGARAKKLDWQATWRNRMREVQSRRTGRNGNGANQPPSYQTAAERRDASFKRQLAIVEELRSGSVGAVDEVVRRESH